MDEVVELAPGEQRELAARVEGAQRGQGAVRYGSLLRVGLASVVLNPDSPLLAANFAAGLDGTPAEAGATLRALERVFAEVGREEAVVVGSPTSLPELDLVAEEVGWDAVEEGAVLVHDGEPAAGRSAVRLLVDADLPVAAELLADTAGLGRSGARRLVRHLGHLADDPRAVLLVAPDRSGAGVDGVAVGFVADGTGLLSTVVVAPRRWRRGMGSALAATAVTALRSLGAQLVATAVEAGGSAERFAEAVGFTPAYPTTTFARRVG